VFSFYFLLFRWGEAAKCGVIDRSSLNTNLEGAGFFFLWHPLGATQHRCFFSWRFLTLTHIKGFGLGLDLQRVNFPHHTASSVGLRNWVILFSLAGVCSSLDCHGAFRRCHMCPPLSGVRYACDLERGEESYWFGSSR
jgi:hypothetical protein